MGYEEIKAVLLNFPVPVDHVEIKPLSQGYINRSFVVEYNGSPDFLLQQINTRVFSNVDALMGNLAKALPYLEDAHYSGPELVHTKQGTSYLRTKKGHCWRLMTYVPNSTSFLYCQDPGTAREAGRILGIFHSLMSKARLEEFVEFLPGFHSLELRKRQFDQALDKAVKTRKFRAEKAISFAHGMTDTLLTKGDIAVPRRVCHYDTKMSNFLFSKTEGKALCLVDLDTLMPGYFYYDFGDAIRTVVSSTVEDEKELDKITFRWDHFEAFLKGLKPHSTFLRREDIRALPYGVVLMPFLHGIRALIDFLLGDVYYQVSYPDQNLDRALSLFRFASLAEESSAKIKEVIQKYLGTD